MPEDLFAGDVAARYDTWDDEEFDPEVIAGTVEVLAELAGGGPALELGIGTGRIALPLHRRGVPVHGIDLSPDMVAQLLAKPDGDGVGVSIGDFAHATVDGTFTLAYLVFNTIGNLTSQDEQVACFRNAARHLSEGGTFVIEVGVPGVQRLPRGESFRAFAVGPGYVGIDEYDVVGQGLVSHHYHLGEHPSVRSIPFRYVWPTELDLMARLAGLALQDRWQDWDRAPFTELSTKHVSVWRKVSDTAF